MLLLNEEKRNICRRWDQNSVHFELKVCGCLYTLLQCFYSLEEKLKLFKRLNCCGWQITLDFKLYIKFQGLVAIIRPCLLFLWDGQLVQVIQARGMYNFGVEVVNLIYGTNLNFSISVGLDLLKCSQCGWMMSEKWNNGCLLFHMKEYES